MATRRKAKNVSYPSMPISQNGRKFFLTSIPTSDLFSYCFVSSRADDNLQGFQRKLNSSRADDIANYLNQEGGSIPTSIVLSAQEDAEIKYNSKAKTLWFSRAEKSFLVLDGQHRLWGYQKCLEKFGKDLRIPVSIFQGLNREDETRLFIDINTKQVGVPAALLLDIKQLANIESNRDIILRSLFDGVKATKSLAISEKMSPAKSAAGKISRVSFNKAVGQALDSSILREIDTPKRLSLIVNYLSAFERTLPDLTLLTRSAFLESIFDVFEQVIRQSLLSHKNAKTDSIQKVISPIAKYSYPESILRSSGELKKAVRVALAGSIRISPEML